MSPLFYCPIHHKHLIPMGENTYGCPLDVCDYLMLDNSDAENFKVEIRVSFDIQLSADCNFDEPLTGVLRNVQK